MEETQANIEECDIVTDFSAFSNIAGTDVFVTKEPTSTESGAFLRNFAEEEKGLGLACLGAVITKQEERTFLMLFR